MQTVGGLGVACNCFNQRQIREKQKEKRKRHVKEADRRAGMDHRVCTGWPGENLCVAKVNEKTKKKLKKVATN